MEEAVAGTGTVAPVLGIESIDDAIDVDDLVDTVDPIGAASDPRTPTTVEVPTSIDCNPNKSPRDKNIKDMKNKENAFDNGYDSDGEMGPFNNRTDKEGQQLFNEDDDDGVGFVAERLIGDTVDDAIEDTDTIEDDTDTAVHIPIDSDTLNKLTLVQLRLELKLRQQPTSGVKFKLKDRLIKALDKKLPKYTEDYLVKKKAADTEAKKKNSIGGLSSFSKTAFWKELKPNEAVVEEPANPTFKIQRVYAPTVPEEDAAHVPVKHDFDHRFDVPTFSGKTTAYVLTEPRGRNKPRRMKYNRNNEPVTKEVTRTCAVVNPVFIKEYNLSKKTKPHEFANIFLPFKSDKVKTGPGSFSFEKMMKWTALKAAFADAGHSYYKGEYVPFSIDQIRKHSCAFYIFHGLSPSPRAEYKFNHQRNDPVNGNDFVYKSFGPNAFRKHKMVKAFLSLQDPGLPVPARDVDPNWKIRPLLDWMNFIGPKAVLLGECSSVDEMTIGFQGSHKDKRRITYKAEGDGFQCDALCQEGYCYQHYFRNDPAPKQYLKLGLSPLHARVMWLFDSLHDLHHQIGMDNLYNSAAFCRAAYLHSMKVLCHGVVRKGGRGAPKCIIQEEVTDRKKQILVRGTVKAAHLQGDDVVKCLVASSVYDTKPVHYLSMVSVVLEWVAVEKKVYNVDTQKTEFIRFLRLNVIHKYNHTMGHVDVADQLRGSYRIDIYVRNRKWWWAIMFWAFGTLLTNAYVVYIKVNVAEGVEKKHLLSHYDFRKEIALNWLDSSYEPRTHRIKEAPTKKTGLSSMFSSPSSVSTITTASSLRATYCNDSSLAENGALNCRLDTTLPHLPSRKTGTKSQCALHRWTGNRMEAGILYCRSCNIHLCIDCYEIFHTESNLVAKKKELTIKYNR
jgi:hypothetical protein